MAARANAHSDQHAGTRFFLISLSRCAGDFQTECPSWRPKARQYTPASPLAATGLTSGTDHLFFKLIVGYRFDF
jgi:hypothetical protein